MGRIETTECVNLKNVTGGYWPWSTVVGVVLLPRVLVYGMAYTHSRDVEHLLVLAVDECVAATVQARIRDNHLPELVSIDVSVGLTADKLVYGVSFNGLTRTVTSDTDYRSFQAGDGVSNLRDAGIDSCDL